MIGSALMVCLILGFTLFFNIQKPVDGYGATTGEFRTAGSGNWNAVATWQRYNGSSWVAATAAPSNSDGIITIQNGHTVTVTAAVTADQIVVASGGTLNLNSGVTLTLANGAGNDLDVTGIFKNAGTVTISAGAVINYQSGGKYQHNYSTTGGAIPTATWNSNSTCEIIGYTNNNAAPTGLTGFPNFTWNCPSQNQAISLGGAISSLTGNLNIVSTGSSTLTDATTNHTLAVGGNVTISGGTFYLGTKSSQASTFTVGGNFTQSGGTFTMATGSSGTGSMTVSGDFLLSGGTLSAMTGSNATGNIILLGNYTHSGGTLTVGGNSATVVNMMFQKGGIQPFISGGTVSGNVDYTVRSGSTLSLGSNIVSGRNFTLSAGAGLRIGSATGITSSGATGNIQVSGTRTFNTGADYTYNGSAAQVTGNGLPATVRNLTINNSANVTLTATVAASGIVTFTSGKLITGAFELQSTNTSTSSLAGYSSASYVVGNLRRSVSGSGSYDYPVGTTAYYELLNLNLNGTTGISNVLGKFTIGNPVSAVAALSLDASNILVNNVQVESLLNYGYWTLTPNSVLLTGNYDVTMTETGWNNVFGSGATFTGVYRATSLVGWSAAGTHDNSTQSATATSVKAVRSKISLAMGDFAIGYAEYLYIKNPLLESGVDGQVGATYRFSNIASNVDMLVQIMSLDGGATLSDLDHFSAGYDESWQPFIDAAPNTTSSILWQFRFKIAGTTTDTILPALAITGIDIDGDGSNLKEFVEATMPYSYALDPSTQLTVTNNSGLYRATSPYANVAKIDTTQRRFMFQINYRNVNIFSYRTGAINGTNSVQTRQNSLFFRPFFTGNIALPIKLVYFEGKLKNNQVKLNWETASEVNNDYFTIERSSDGENFEKLFTLRGAGNSSTQLSYSAVDENPLPGYSYYRLKQTDYDGHSSYSEVQTIRNKGGEDLEEAIDVKSIAPNPFQDHCDVNFLTKGKGEAKILLINSNGAIIREKSETFNDGYNTITMDDLADLPSGVYFVNIVIGDKKTTKKVIKE